MIPIYYEFINTVKVMSGLKALDNIAYELSILGSKRPIVITDKGVVGAGLTETLIDAIGGTDTTVGALYDDVPVDSSNKVVNEIAALYRERGCDSIVAIGGGSVIDTAKGVNIVITEETDDLLKFMGNNRVTKRMKPFIVVPTTAGTGSEVTSAAVILNVDQNTKMQFTSPFMLPNVAILDPRMTLTMPPKITAATALDALTHSVEAFIGPQKNPISDAFASAAITLIRENIFKVLEDGKDKEARLAMANAALMAGVAFSNSMVGVVHATAHALGGVCHVPHGIANGIMLPHGLELNMDVVAESLASLLFPLAGEEEFAATPKEARASAAVAAVRKLTSKLSEMTGVPTRLKDAGVEEDKLEEVARIAMNDGALSFNPKELSFEEVFGVVKAAY